jgi:hypothetical protein
MGSNPARVSPRTSPLHRQRRQAAPRTSQRHSKATVVTRKSPGQQPAPQWLPHTVAQCGHDRCLPHTSPVAPPHGGLRAVGTHPASNIPAQLSRSMTGRHAGEARGPEPSPGARACQAHRAAGQAPGDCAIAAPGVNNRAAARHDWHRVRLDGTAPWERRWRARSQPTRADASSVVGTKR